MTFNSDVSWCGVIFDHVSLLRDLLGDWETGKRGCERVRSNSQVVQNFKFLLRRNIINTNQKWKEDIKFSDVAEFQNEI